MLFFITYYYFIAYLLSYLLIYTLWTQCVLKVEQLRVGQQPVHHDSDTLCCC